MERQSVQIRVMRILKSFVIPLLFLLTACAAEFVLSEQDSGKTFAARIGDTPVILLPENPTTGYSWQFFITSENQQIISDIKETYIAPDTQMPGAGGLKKYSFTVRQKGTVTVTGFYRRPWEKPDDINDQKVTFTFNIRQ